MADLPPAPFPSCPVCAAPSATGERCGPCTMSPPAFAATVAAFRYGFPVDAMIRSLKFRREIALAGVLGAGLGRAVTLQPVPDLLVPVPLSDTRSRERGFNQSLEIARCLPASLAGRIDRHLLVRRTDTGPQATLPLEQRARNVRGAFAATRPMAGEAVVLVDDVMTSGATLEAAAGALLEAGAREVRAWVVARTPPPGESPA